jgi:BirA family transcriptional regulator, biotin operon repressor / biotin---[acetyl-CoA-carboxylase] ligase
MSFRALVERHGEVESTMALARERARAGAPTGTSVVATTQRAGRGRHGRTWFSPAGGLWATVILRPSLPPDGSPLATLSLVAGVAACSAARTLGVPRAQLKWPNDVVVGDRKLCGILVEATEVENTTALVLIGIGMNLAPRATVTLPADLADCYVGLGDAAHDPRVASVDASLAVLLDDLEAWYGRWRDEGVAPVVAAWRDVDALAGVEVRADGPGGVVTGRADGVTATGALRVITLQGVIEVTTGEVTRVRPVRAP